ncbi:MAG: flavin reductase [Tannerella sp.]|jgi:flavin reductase (DIM6/NTAB) family NADH-FMN oxidoreductase RutF|nr:flavin reductase [Tannerella sp.]
MKKSVILLFVLTALISSGCNCNNSEKAEQKQENETTVAAKTILSREEIQTRSFDELFKSIEAKNMPGDVFTLVGSDYTVITAGNPSLYNSMVAGWGGMGILFNKPATWCMLRANRYTLEVMRNEKTYTMSYFDDTYKDDIMLFGTKSGRDSDKMKESKLSSVQTPSGNMTYKEAKLIIECKLTEVTTVSPNDFYSEEGRQFVVDAYEEVKDYHKIVFGEITNVWVRK